MDIEMNLLKKSLISKLRALKRSLKTIEREYDCNLESDFETISSLIEEINSLTK